MTARVLVDGLADDRVSALDRGLAYGDGLFETIRAVDGEVPLWDRHMARLSDGCRRLGLPAPDAGVLSRESARSSANHGSRLLDVCRRVFSIADNARCGER